jgi:hypothetical protein
MSAGSGNSRGNISGTESEAWERPKRGIFLWGKNTYASDEKEEEHVAQAGQLLVGQEKQWGGDIIAYAGWQVGRVCLESFCLVHC